MHDVSKEFVQMLQVIKATDDKVNIDHVVEILLGKATNNVKAYKHDQLDLFGIGKSKDKVFWKSAIRLGLLENLVRKNIAQYGLLSLTESGEAFIAKPRPVQMPVDTEFENVDEENFEKVEIEAEYDEELFMQLKELQRQVASKMNLPPYVIFQETSLEDMATKFPVTIEELENISGVGKNKAQKYGAPFVKLISEYVEENDIDRPQDLVLKTVANKSGKKIAIIQNIDKKNSLEDIARSQGMVLQELLDEIENIVYSGTKIDLSYYIDEIIDDDVKDEIFDYFRSTENNDLDLAVDEFEGDFSHDEMQMFRIQFISEMANWLRF